MCRKTQHILNVPTEKCFLLVSKWTENGDVKGLRRDLEAMAEVTRTFSSSLDELKNTADGFDTKTYFEGDDFAVQMLAVCAEKGVDVRGEAPVFEMFPYRVKLDFEDTDEKYLLQADPEGDFIANAPLKKIYRSIFGQPVKYNVNFTKTRHCRDYVSFMSHLFIQMGYRGRAYGWTPGVSAASLLEATSSIGYLLRTKIRAAIEFLDQLYQYGQAGRTTAGELGQETFAEGTRFR